MASNTDLRGQGAREHYTAQTSFLNIGLNTTNFVASAILTMGNLPAGARILRAYSVVGTAFNAQTNNGFTIGTTTGGAQIFAGNTTAGSTVGTNVLALVTTGVYVTTQTPVFVIANISGTAATTGLADVILEYATMHGAAEQF